MRHHAPSFAALIARTQQEVGMEAPIPPAVLAVQRGYALACHGGGPADPGRYVYFDGMRAPEEQEREIAGGCARLLLMEAGMDVSPDAIAELAWQLCQVAGARALAAPLSGHALTA